MKSSLKFATVIALALSFFVGSVFAYGQTDTLKSPTAKDSEQDFHIDKDGNVSMYQAKIFQIAGTTFYMRYYIGLAFIRILVKTSPETKVKRLFGDEVALNEIGVNDTVNVFGKIESGADNLSIVASSITDFSNQKELTGFTGVITAMGSTTDSFTMLTKNQGVITINIGTTTQIKKGSRIIPSDLVRVGDLVTDTAGTYDHKTKELFAQVVALYIDKKIYAERNFEGVLKTISADSPPTLTVNIEGKDYSVALSANTTILNKSKKPTSIKRYLVGDTVRFYGAIREAEEPIIDAQIVRNLSLQ